MNARGAWSAAALALLIAACMIVSQGCRRRGLEENAPMMLSRDEISRRDPDAELAGCWKAWIVERSPRLGVYYIEMITHSPLEFSRHADRRILVLAGAMKLRLNSREASFGPGSLALIPPRAPYRIVKQGREKLLFAMFLSPDDHHGSLLEPAREETR